MLYCPHCGSEVSEKDYYCNSCGRQLNEYSDSPPMETRKGLTQNLDYALKFVLKNPDVLIPEVLSGILSILILGAWEVYMDSSGIVQRLGEYSGYETEVLFIADSSSILGEALFLLLSFFGLLFIIGGISGLFTFTTVSMIWDRYTGGSGGLGEAAGKVLGKVSTLFFAALFANLLSLTIILIPASIFAYVVMIVEETGFREGLSQGFRLSINRIGASIAIIFVYGILRVLIEVIPVVGQYLTGISSAFIMVVIVDMYLGYKREKGEI